MKGNVTPKFVERLEGRDLVSSTPESEESKENKDDLPFDFTASLESIHKDVSLPDFSNSFGNSNYFSTIVPGAKVKSDISDLKFFADKYKLFVAKGNGVSDEIAFV